MKYYIFISLIALVLLTFGCDYGPRAIGEINQIIVFADDEDWNQTAITVKEVYERIIETPQYEKSFIVSHPPIENFTLYRKYHTIILLGTLESDGIMGQLLNDNITPENKISVEKGEKYAFQQRDVWANNQYLLILVAPTIQELKNKITENGDRLYQLVNNEANNNLEMAMYKRKEQVEISNQLFEKYGFTFRVQHDYVMKERVEQNAVFFRRYEPDRMILIHWVDTTDVNFIPESWVIEKRTQLGRELLGGRILNQESIKTRRTEFAGFFALESRGLWEHPEDYIGGPMINYTFFDDRTNRIYMIDLSVYAPDKVNEKEPFMRQLEVIASTFTTSSRYRSR